MGTPFLRPRLICHRQRESVSQARQKDHRSAVVFFFLSKMVLVVEDGLAVVPVPVAERDADGVLMDVDASVTAVEHGTGVEQVYIAPVGAVLPVGVAEADDLTAVLLGVHGNVVVALFHELEVPVGRVELVPADVVKGRAGVHGHGVHVAADGNTAFVPQALQVVQRRPVPLPVAAEDDRVDDRGVGLDDVAQTFRAAVGV